MPNFYHNPNLPENEQLPPAPEGFTLDDLLDVILSQDAVEPKREASECPCISCAEDTKWYNK